VMVQAKRNGSGQPKWIIEELMSVWNDSSVPASARSDVVRLWALLMDDWKDIERVLGKNGSSRQDPQLAYLLATKLPEILFFNKRIALESEEKYKKLKDWLKDDELDLRVRRGIAQAAHPFWRVEDIEYLLEIGFETKLDRFICAHKSVVGFCRTQASRRYMHKAARSSGHPLPA
jgi:hypothetical protein